MKYHAMNGNKLQTRRFEMTQASEEWLKPRRLSRDSGIDNDDTVIIQRSSDNNNDIILMPDIVDNRQDNNSDTTVLKSHTGDQKQNADIPVEKLNIVFSTGISTFCFWRRRFLTKVVVCAKELLVSAMLDYAFHAQHWRSATRTLGKLPMFSHQHFVEAIKRTLTPVVNYWNL